MEKKNSFSATAPIPVALVRCCHGEHAAHPVLAKEIPSGPANRSASSGLSLPEAVDTAFALAGYSPGRGERVLVKPNLVRADSLSCTNPDVVRAVCEWLLDRGAVVSVGDSPGIGKAGAVARKIGLTAALAGVHADAVGTSGGPLLPFALDKAVTRHVPGLGPIKIARHALEVDSILSLPRLKAHCQTGITCAVKNLFGCVCGIHKALAHVKHGDNGPGRDDFCRFIAGLTALLPPQAALVDALTCMHVTGPSGGEPYPLGLIAASTSCAAVDTAVYGLLGLSPERLPLWRALREMAAPGAFSQDILLRGNPVADFAAAGFVVPERLTPHSFNPWRLCCSAVKRFLAGLRP